MLKKALLTVFLFIVFASTSYCQNLSIGLKGGGNISRMSFEEPSFDNKYKFGPSLGISFSYQLNSYIAVESDLIYSIKGTRHIANTFVGTTKSNDEYDYSLDYISVPLLAKFYLPTESSLRPYAELGTSFNFLMNNKREFIPDPNLTHTMEVKPTDFTSKTKAFDYGLIFSLGTDYHWSSRIITLEFRYDTGLTNIDNGLGNHYNYISGITVNSGSIKNRSLSVLLGYSWSF